MTLPLADSEREEICAAFDVAERKLLEAGQAMEQLTELLEGRLAFVGKQKIDQIRKGNEKIGSNIFRLSVIRYKMLKFGTARGIK